MVDQTHLPRGPTLETNSISTEDGEEVDYHSTDLKSTVRKTSEDGGEPDFDSTSTKSIGAPDSDSDPSDTEPPDTDNLQPPPFAELTNNEKAELMAAIKILQRDQEAIKQLQRQHDQRLNDIISRQPILPQMFQVIRNKAHMPEVGVGLYHNSQVPSSSSGYGTQSQTTPFKNTVPYDHDEIYVRLEQVYTNLMVFQASAGSLRGVIGASKLHARTYCNVNDMDPVKRENEELRKKIAILERELRSKKPPNFEGLTVGPNPITPQYPSGQKEMYSILPSKGIVIGRPTPPLPALPGPIDIRATEVTFKWTITEYSRKLREERVRGGKQYSSSFYLSHCGYRAQMEAYLNGNGTAANRCMSVFLRVLKGEYDRSLKWPVNLHMVVILVNQSGQNTECLKAGGHQFQFMQPQGGADSETDCWGLIEFVSHDLIRRKDYISNDKIVIKCRLMILPP